MYVYNETYLGFFLNCAVNAKHFSKQSYGEKHKTQSVLGSHLVSLYSWLFEVVVCDSPYILFPYPETTCLLYQIISDQFQIILR